MLSTQTLMPRLLALQKAIFAASSGQALLDGLLQGARDLFMAHPIEVEGAVLVRNPDGIQHTVPAHWEGPQLEMAAWLHQPAGTVWIEKGSGENLFLLCLQLTREHGVILGLSRPPEWEADLQDFWSLVALAAGERLAQVCPASGFRLVSERALQQSEVLLQVASGFSRAESTQHLIETLVSEVNMLIPVMSIGIMERQQDRLVMAGMAGPQTLVPELLSLPLTAAYPVCEAVRTAQPLVFQNKQQMVDAHPVMQANADQIESQANVVFPVQFGAVPTGALYFAFDARYTLLPEDVSFLHTLASQVAQALERLKLQEESKRAVQELRDSQRFLQRLTDTTPVVLTLSDLRGRRIIYTNERLSDILGYTSEAFQTKTALEIAALVHPDDLPMVVQSHRDLLTLQDGATIEREYRMRHLSGRWVWLFSRQTVFARDEAGVPTVALGCALDITDRKQAEQALQESEKRFQLIADQAPVMVFMADPDQSCTFLNRGWLEYTGHTLEQDLGFGWTQSIHPDDLPHCIEVTRAAHASLQPFDLECRIQRHDGAFRWTVNRGVPRFTPEGEYRGYIGVLIDIHDRKLAEQQVQESEQQLRAINASQKRFVADVAHELRNPLTSIQGNMDLMVRHPNLPEEDKKEIIHDVQKEASRLGRLVHDMLQLARGDAGAEIRPEDMDFREVLTDACREIERAHPEHRFELLPLDNLEMVGDSDRLKQLCIILIENAAKYTPAGGHIRIGVQQDPDGLLLEVSDNGAGISEEDLPRVFERFYRADRSRQRSEDPGGTGLGLPIAQWIVEQHGGKIWLESRLGKGTTAKVHLPRNLD